MTLRVLLVDDDADFRKRFTALARSAFTVVQAAGYDEGLALVRRGGLDAVLLDIDLQEERSGIDLLQAIHAIDPDLPVIMVSGDDRAETIGRAIRAGAEGYTRKSVNLEILQAQIEQNIENATWRRHARTIQSQPDGLIGSGATMAALRREIRDIAGTMMRVLIRGESGSGKEIVAHAIHEAGARRHGRFVTVNSAVGTDDLFDDDFFGHEQGSYTGATRPRSGKLELAKGGTLFLDEVGKMNPARQAKLLRVIEDASYERIGGTEAVTADVRFLSASNEDIEGKIAAGTFYGDFYYRIGEYQLRVPPLRERAEDIPELARFLLDRFCSREGRPPLEMADGALDCCLRYGWPGNVRELDSVLKRAALGCPVRLTAAAVQEALESVRRNDLGTTTALLPLEEARAAWEKSFLAAALARHGGRVTETAKALGISRTTLYAKMEQYGMQGGAGAGRTSD